jgi:hypothetical protein
MEATHRGGLRAVSCQSRLTGTGRKDAHRKRLRRACRVVDVMLMCFLSAVVIGKQMTEAELS